MYVMGHNSVTLAAGDIYCQEALVPGQCLSPHRATSALAVLLNVKFPF